MHAITRKIGISSLMVIFATTLSACLTETGEDAGNQNIGVTSPPSPTPAPAPTPTPTPTPNSPPVISDTPGAQVLIGNQYSFTPTASDPDGDPLTFSVQNKPSWAQFSAAIGTLSGTPSLADVGVYSNIAVSVSDGDLSDSLPQFSVTVVQNANGSFTLSWTAPTENEDGTALTDLAAYKFYYGTSSGNYSDQVRVDNPGLTTYVIENISSGTYYIAATAINNAGVEGLYSNEVMKQVP